VDLLERGVALAALAEAREAAAAGTGRVVLVSGEPGIGKTALVTRFAESLGPGARVLIGSCDDLTIARPLGPIRDLARNASPSLEEALAAGAAPHEIQTLVISELAAPPQPTVLVLEDVHWADEATFDTITVLGRRIGSLPALLVLTYRTGEAPPGHPLHAVVGAFHAEDAIFLTLGPLSETAVASLSGEDADRVYAATGGNPFYVTELLAFRPPSELPPSIASSVRGRAAQLDDAGRRLVELVSVVPGRVTTSVLDAVMPEWAAAAEEPERRQLLEIEGRHVCFRHELARNAIHADVPSARRRGLHAEILAALLAADADPAEIVHHADAAGAEDVVADYAVVAARRAAALGANREAHSHYLRASEFLDRLAPLEAAAVHEELAATAYLVGRVEDALPALASAIAVYREHGDAAAVGRCTRALSRCHWYAGEVGLARETAQEAVAILEPLGDSVELAHAYGMVSRLAMLADDYGQSLLWGDRALELATRLGDERTRAHMLVNLASTRAGEDPRAVEALLEAYEVADDAREWEEGVRALGNVGYVLMAWVQPEEALDETRRALAYAQEHEIHSLGAYIEINLAALRLRTGEWAEAERIVRAEAQRGGTIARLHARSILAELAVRRGDPDADEVLAAAAAEAERTGELQRTLPVLELELESALMNGAPLPSARLEQLVAESARGRVAGCRAMRIAAWAAVAGLDVHYDRPMSAPHAAMLRRDWRAAADAFGAVGWDYDRALMLSLLDHEDALVEAIELARSLSAEPLTKHVTVRLRELGLRVPRGPREATRANPAGLTARQLEVLALVAEGLSNTEIAERLVVSPRTAEHHVTALLAKLGASSRHEAARRAAELQLMPRSEP
jgi:ATP/maltotriose-dependent transcriptional regulator MalT